MDVEKQNHKKITQNTSVGRGFVKEPQKKMRRGSGKEIMPAHRAWLIIARR